MDERRRYLSCWMFQKYQSQHLKVNQSSPWRLKKVPLMKMCHWMERSGQTAGVFDKTKYNLLISGHDSSQIRLRGCICQNILVAGHVTYKHHETYMSTTQQENESHPIEHIQCISKVRFYNPIKNIEGIALL